jgi:hypothetical protein
LLRSLPSLALIALVSTACQTRTDFTFLDSPPVFSGGSPTHLVHAPDGRPWLAYTDFRATRPRVATWTGFRWETLGQPTYAKEGRTSYDGQLVFNASGQLLLGEREAGSDDVRIRAWEGRDWKDVAAFFPSSLGVDEFRLRLDPAGQPILATRTWNPQGPDEIFVRSWTGDGWKQLGSELASNVPKPDGADPFLDSPRMEVDPEGHPIVAHRESAGSGYRVWVQRWTGTDWRPLGGPLETSTFDLALDAEGRPCVARVINVSPSPEPAVAIHVSRWNGTDWEPLGNQLTPIPELRTALGWPVLRFDPAGRPVVLFSQIRAAPGHRLPDYELHLRRWNGTAWEALGQPLAGAEKRPTEWSVILEQKMSIGPDGAPLLAWTQRLCQDDEEDPACRFYFFVARYNEGH